MLDELFELSNSKKAAAQPQEMVSSRSGETKEKAKRKSDKMNLFMSRYDVLRQVEGNVQFLKICVEPTFV